MQFFIDSADVGEIRELAATGLVDGVTTNPSLIARSGARMADVLAQICDLVSGSVSAEVTATSREDMIREGLYLASIARNITVKLPLTLEGLGSCQALSARGIAVNVTLCFSAGQAMLAAKSGAAYVSPFIGRLDDRGEDGLGLIADLCTIFQRVRAQAGGWQTRVLAASIRHADHVVGCARLGADVVTLPPRVFRELFRHELTDQGLAAFLEDWAKTGQSILGNREA